MKLQTVLAGSRYGHRLESLIWENIIIVEHEQEVEQWHRSHQIE